MKHQYQSFTRNGRQFQSLKRQVHAVWTSVSFIFIWDSDKVCRLVPTVLHLSLAKSKHFDFYI